MPPRFPDSELRGSGRRVQVRADRRSLAFGSQRRCLHEQEALGEMYTEAVARAATGLCIGGVSQDGNRRGSCLPAGIVVLPQRKAGGFNLNTFLRWSHYDSSRKQLQRYDGDRPSGLWRYGDFAGHCTGLSHVRRGLCARGLLDSVVSGDEADPGATPLF